MSAKTLSEHPRFVDWWFDLLCDVTNDSDARRHQKRLISEFRTFAQEYESHVLFSDQDFSKRFYISVIRQQQIWSLELIRLCYFRQPLPPIQYLDLFWQYDPLSTATTFDVDELRMMKILTFARDHRLCTHCGSSVKEVVILFRQPVFPSRLLDLLNTLPKAEFPIECYYGAVQALDLTRIEYLEKLDVEYPPDLVDHLFKKEMFERFRQFEEDDHRLIEEVATDHPAKLALRLADQLIRRGCELPRDAVLHAVKSRYLSIIPEFVERKYPLRRDVFYRKLFVVLREASPINIDLSDERWKQLLGGERSKRYQYASTLVQLKLNERVSQSGLRLSFVR